MSALLQKIRRSIRRHDLLPPGSRVLIGLSGGSDSVALTLLLRDLSRHQPFEVVAVAHLNHQIRPRAAADAAFCRAFAERHALECVVDQIDVAGYAAAGRLSIEDAARRVRYDFLNRAAAAVGATVTAVGHTEDDQAETFLLKLARGAGLTGLGGIYPRRDSVIRPLIDVSRAQLQAFLRERGETWVDDETNADLANPRNRVRHRVLPELEAAYGGAVRPAIGRAAALAREDGQLLDELAARRLCQLTAGTTAEVDAARIMSEPAPLRRRLLGQLLRTASGREIGLDHIESALDVCRGEAAGADLPGVRVELRRGKLVLIQQDAGSK